MGATCEHIPPVAILTAVVPWLRVLQLYYYFYTTLKIGIYNGTISELNEENSSDVIGILFRKLFKRAYLYQANLSRVPLK
ncbi:hypothetical protein ACHWQZ_G006367 [Mnemiopsis leidyi]